MFDLVVTGGGGGKLSLDDELFSVDGASHVLTFGGKDSFSPDIAEFWSREKRYAVGTIGETWTEFSDSKLSSA